MAKSVKTNLTDWQVAPGFEDRVRTAFNGATLAEIARKSGQNYHTLRNQVKARRGVPIELLIGLAVLTNHTIDWFVTGEEPRLRQNAGQAADGHLTPAVRAEIRRQVVETVGAVLLSSQDRQYSDSLLEELRKQFESTNEVSG